MSYTKVKSIVFNYDKKEVIMETASSNLLPIRYYKSPSRYLSNLWQEEGLKAVEYALTFDFWSGCLQGSGNKFYTRGKKLQKLFPWGDSTNQEVKEFIKNNF